MNDNKKEMMDEELPGNNNGSFDPDDPNIVHLPLLKQLEQLYEDLPEGWIRITDPTKHKSKAPFIHVESGKESFRHPNRPQMDTIIQEIQEAEQKMKQTGASTTALGQKYTNSRIKKLRMMLQTGIPLAAVEQKAKLEGIDMVHVLADPTFPNGENDGTTSSNIIPMPLLKKYKRMLRSGVPMEAVQQMAQVEGKLSKEQVSLALADILENHNKENSKPLESQESSSVPKHEEIPSPIAGSTEDQTNDEDANECRVHSSFTVNGANVSFTRIGTTANLLANLVRKMVQTVQKRASTSKDGKTMVVNEQVLYNALGGLKGVQIARDDYNSTYDSADSNEASALQLKRQAFCEMARSIGMDVSLQSGEDDKTVEIPGLDELIRHVEYVYRDELQAHRELMAEGWYDFDGLALMYPPGSKVLAKSVGGGGVDMLCQVAWNRYEQGRTIMGQSVKYFKLCLNFVAAVGATHATVVEVVEGMESFEGRRPIKTALTFVPLASYTAQEQEVLLNRYRQRGELYNKVALCGKHSFMAYEKGSFFMKRSSGTEKKNGATALATGGRVVVDTQGAFDNGHSLSFGYDEMVMGIKYKYKEYNLHMRSSSKNGGDPDGSSLTLFDQVPSQYLDMVWPLVVGFSLTAKAWGDILVDGLQEIQWQEDIFDRLVLAENRKMMVKALVRHSTNSFQDLVQGKGEGTVFLMYGPPGVGKTLTAEAVAELLHKPLYSLSLGTLGSTPRELEEHLGQIMTMSAKWEALVLLDEADSFLETRSSKSSLERNAMVSVMLKLVEYFSGILFLTSNRIDSLDPAFQTRITLALRYENLDQEGRTKVWKNLLLKSGFGKELDEGMIIPDVLAEDCLNGREIKNALRLAMALSAEKEEALSQSILLETIEIVNDYKSAMKNDAKDAFEYEQTC